MKDKYGREVKLVRIQGRNYEVYAEAKSHVPIQYSDKVRYVQIKRPVDVNSDGIVDLKKGQIIGRLAKEIQGKPSSVEANVHISNKRMLKDRKKKQKEYYIKKVNRQRLRRLKERRKK